MQFGTTSFRVQRTTGGTTVTGSSVGTLVAATNWKAALSSDGAGNITASFNGSAISSVTGAPTSGLTTFFVGSDATGTGGQLAGEILSLQILPYASDNATLQTLST
jgi:hypothetical protein